MAGGGSSGAGCLLLDPDGGAWMFDPGDHFSGSGASISFLESQLGSQDWRPLPIPSGEFSSSVWLSGDDLLTVGNQGFLVTSIGLGKARKGSSSQASPMGVIHLGSGVVATCGGSVTLGLTDTTTWEYCEVARLALSPSVNEMVHDSDGCIFIASTYPASEPGMAFSVTRLRISSEYGNLAKRETLAGLVKKLIAAPARSSVDPGEARVSGLQARISTLTKASHQELESQMEFRRRANLAFEDLKRGLSEAFRDLSRRLEYFRSYYHGDISDALLELRTERTPFATYAWGGQFVPPGGWPGPRVTVAIGMRLMDAFGPADIVGVIKVEHVHDNLADVHTVWKGVYLVPVGSEQQAQAVSDISSGLLMGIPRSLELLVEFL